MTASFVPHRHRHVRNKPQPPSSAAVRLESVHALEHGPVANSLLSRMSVRQLWVLRRVCRTFRDIATDQLQAMMRPVVGGGHPCGESSITLEILDMSTMRWVWDLTLPNCRADSAACVTDTGELLIVGGDTYPDDDRTETRGWSVSPTALKLDPRSMSWSEDVPAMNFERATFRLVLCPNGRTLAIGGVDDEESPVATVEALDGGADNWITVAPMKRSRHSFAAACLPCGRVVVAGGQDKTGKFLAAAEVFDPSLNRWSLLPDVPSQCRGASAGWIREADGRFCVCGLGAPGTTRRNCYALASNLSRWEFVWEADFPRRAHDAGGSSSGGYIPVRGGCLLIGGCRPHATDGADGEEADSDEKGLSSLDRDDSLACGDLYDESTGKVYHLPHKMRHPRQWTFGGAIQGNRRATS